MSPSAPHSDPPLYLGFDPGREKCGMAIVAGDRTVHHQGVIPGERAIATLQAWCRTWPITLIVMGDQTTAPYWRTQVTQSFAPGTILPIVLVDERYSSLEARDRYWQDHPPRGWMRLVPLGMRQPPRPIDDVVAVLLVERYLAKVEAGGKRGASMGQYNHDPREGDDDD